MSLFSLTMLFWKILLFKKLFIFLTNMLINIIFKSLNTSAFLLFLNDLINKY